MQLGDDLTAIGDAPFEGCAALTEVVTDSAAAIAWCAANLPETACRNRDTDCGYFYAVTAREVTITGIHDASVATLALPAAIRAYPVVAAGGLANLANLTTVELPETLATLLPEAFRGCTRLYRVTGGTLKRIGANAFRETALRSISLPAQMECIDESAFQGCSRLSLASIDAATIGAHAIEGCNAIASLTLGDSVTTIGEYAFYGCTRLATLAFGTALAEIGANAFPYCTALTDLAIPDSVTRIGDGAFVGCSGLVRLSLGRNLDVIGSNAFLGCTGIREVTIGRTIAIDSFLPDPAQVTAIILSDGIAAIDAFAFFGCTGLQSVVIPDSVTAIGESAFEGCAALTDLAFGNGLTAIDAFAFRDCTALTTLELPDSLASLGEGVFEGCTALYHLRLPDAIAELPEGLFDGCTALATLVFGNGVTAIADGAIPAGTVVCTVNPYVLQYCAAHGIATRPIRSVACRFAAGWNLVGIPFALDDETTARLLRHSLYRLDAVNGCHVAAEAPFLPGEALWLHLKAPMNFSFIGSDDDASGVQVASGWNLASPTGEAEAARPDGESVSEIWRWDAQQGQARPVGEDEAFKPGLGYWLRALREATIWNE